ncbi:hypothetical protein PVAP13_8KG288600 [Panicum virgatum]|uniref:DUF4220 domain-containing protein n=2 Tax=Panicum virgatum TaxID=38727 RepID=A0A8T0PKI7_PANVG|nr:hypothetical protein PVAP13_8KG288600 [Panicum virgatum]
MGFWSDVQWWEDWQLRFLVLASLCFQYFLFAAALLRKRCVPPWFRSLVWLAYQGGDVVAVYALATLFNRHRKDEVATGAAHLDTLWAPVLLLHLGGQDGITAYGVEDNENWRRYLLVAASQIAIAIYVFCKSWTGWFHDQRLLRAAILLFVPGVVKCLEKPLALRNATVNSIANSSDPTMEVSIEEDDGTLPTAMDSLEEFVTAAKECVEREAKRDPPLFFDDTMNDEPYHLFVDLSHPYSIRLRNLQVMAARSGKEEAHDRVRAAVSQAFDRLFTKHKASYGGVLRAVVVLLTFADIGLFQESRRRSTAYARADVVVTYVLLCCTAALEFVSACVVLGSGLPLPDDQLPQYNLIGYLAGNLRRPRVRHLAFVLGVEEQLDWLWYTAPPEPSRRITELVHDHVAGGWKGYINAAAERSSTSRSPVEDYRRFNDGRGQRTVERAGCGGGRRGGVERSLHLPFDESVVVWHLATELCYFDHVDAGGEATRNSRVISNYMVYLLLVRPWMLMPGARRGLLLAVYTELRRMLKNPPASGDEDDEEAGKKKKAPPMAMDEIARKIIQKVRNPPPPASSGGARRPPPPRKAAADLVRNAWELAYDLMEFSKKKTEQSREKRLAEEIKKTAGQPVSNEKMVEIVISAGEDGDDEMWKVIQGVWVEMLCFSAGRCRGYLHAASLCRGGEYLSYVWLLLSYMGMETMAERTQRTELPAEGDGGGLVTPPDPDDDDDGDEPAQPPKAGGAQPSGAAATSSVNKKAVAAPPAAASGAAVVPVDIV